MERPFYVTLFLFQAFLFLINLLFYRREARFFITFAQRQWQKSRQADRRNENKTHRNGQTHQNHLVSEHRHHAAHRLRTSVLALHTIQVQRGEMGRRAHTGLLVGHQGRRKTALQPARQAARKEERYAEHANGNKI